MVANRSIREGEAMDLPQLPHVPSDVTRAIVQSLQMLWMVRGALLHQAKTRALELFRQGVPIPRAALLVGQQLNLPPRRVGPGSFGPLNPQQIRQYHRRQEQRERRPGQDPRMRRRQREMEAAAGALLTPAGLDRAVNLNRQYAQSLGWGGYAGRIARLLGFSGSMPAGPTFAEAVARWQQSQPGLTVDGVIGPHTLPRLQAALGVVPNIDLARAVEDNRSWSRQLGWLAYRHSIAQFLLGFEYFPADREFAERVAIWQQGRGDLTVDGIIGPATLPRMLAALEPIFDGSGSPPPQPGVAVTRTPTGRMRRALEAESAGEGNYFVVQMRVGSRPITPRGHERLTEDATLGLIPRGSAQLRDLLVGVVRVDDICKAFDPPEQRRHCLRQRMCQDQATALSQARDHLRRLHRIALSNAPNAFEFAGEALHLIQDSYSNAHTERDLRPAGPPHPIRFIRFFGPLGCPAPIEHQVLPPPDPRDIVIVPSGGLSPFSRAAVAASREYIAMLLRHRSGASPGTISRELNTFLNQHLVLDPGHLPTSARYPRCPSRWPPYSC
jgi:peptidoglycan hydrolase-like protein with peptidoglycan-binding domain